MRSKVRAYSHQGHGPHADQQAGYIISDFRQHALTCEPQPVHTFGSILAAGSRPSGDYQTAIRAARRMPPDGHLALAPYPLPSRTRFADHGFLELEDF